MTDPFQPLERTEGATKWLIEQLNQRNIGYLIVTKSADVADCDVLDKKLAHIQISITSTGNLAPENFEKASAPVDRLKAAESLYLSGFDTRIRLSPFIPQFYDINEILSNRCDNVLFEFLRVNSRILKMMPFIDQSQYTEKSGGYYHLPLAVKLKYIEPFIGKKNITICEDHPEHYAYFKENINPNKDDCCNLRY